MTIPFTAQQALRQYHGVEETWLPSRTTAQELADRVSVYGTYLNTDDRPTWVGTPLRVHRRCDNPMFEISNIIAYNGLMVHGVLARASFPLPESCWFDIRSIEAEGHWIPAEGERLERLLGDMMQAGLSLEHVFLISPFRAVARRLRATRRKYPTLKDAGTVHTAQGKESDVVVVVLGGDPHKPGARTWASKKPNLLNVAASRARRRLYIIGNRDAWGSCRYFDVASRKLSRP